MENTTKVITNEVRWSYVSVIEPKSINGSEPKYSISLIIPKSDTDTINKIRQAIQNAYQAGKDKLKRNGAVPALDIIKTPLRDGDIEHPEDDAYKNAFFVNANSKQRPGVVDTALQRIIDPEQIYSGCWGRASINFFAFNANGNRGIACGLSNLQKTRDDERLGGHASAEQDFAGYGQQGRQQADDDFLA